MEINVDMLYIRFFLHGETANTVGSFMPIILETLERSDFVIVAVNATHCTPEEGCCELLQCVRESRKK